MTIDVVSLAPVNCWDVNVLNQLFDNELFPTRFEFTHHERYPYDADGVILIVPGRYWYERCNEISEALRHYRWVLGIRTGDEQDLFDVNKIVHPNIRWWVQTPRVDRDYGDVRKFGVGWTPHFNSKAFGSKAPDPEVDVFLSAQATHPRRFEAFANMNCMPGMNIVKHETPGFTQGLAPELYSEYMINSKIALAPGGPESPDTFRLYEALQAHCVPVADDVCANYNSAGYWNMVFPDAPFPVITNWAESPGLVRRLEAEWPRNTNRIAAWWMRQKREYVRWLDDDLNQLGVVFDPHSELITVVIPVSPIPSHPDVGILEATIQSVRFWRPDSEIILTFDGVREEQTHMTAAYEEAIRRTLWLCDHHFGNVTPLIFEKHRHQSGMMRETLQHVNTPLLMYVEQDTPLVTDELIDWNMIVDYITSDRADLVRFHHESHVLDVHMYLMQQKDSIFWRTTQWSQRPHVASKRFYSNVMQHFSAETNCFLEEKLASVAQEQPYWKLFLYNPEGNIKRSYHLDGRAGGPKYDESQVF